MIGDPLIFGTLGRDAAFGLPGLTAPGMPGWADEGAVPALGRLEPVPVVPDGLGVDGVTPGAGEPPGWLGAVPIPPGEPPVWAWTDVARTAANPAARSVLTMGGMCLLSLWLATLPTKAGSPLFPATASSDCHNIHPRSRLC